jgi:hypothetical protein
MCEHEGLLSNRRALLDSVALADEVSSWVVSHFQFPRVLEFRTAALAKPGRVDTQQFYPQTINRAGCLALFQSSLFVAADGGQFVLFSVDWGFRAKKTVVFARTDVIYSSDLVLRAGETYVIGYDTRTMMAIKVSPDAIFFRETFSVYITGFVTFGLSVIFAVDWHDVFVCKASRFPANAWLLFSEQEGIDRLVADVTIGVLLILTKRGKLKVFSVLTKQLIGQLDFSGAPVGIVLVTETWHLILVECDQTWYLATIEGKVLKKSRSVRPIAAAVAFGAMSGGDFVTFIDRDGAVSVADVWAMDTGQTAVKIRAEIVAIDYIKSHHLVVVIDRGGCLTTFAFPQFVSD